MTKPVDNAEAFERACLGPTEKVHLKLFIAGMGPRSTQAVADIGALCKKYGDLCTVEIVDIYEHPAAASDAQIVAVPALMRSSPLPIHKLIGAVSNISDVARTLGLMAPAVDSPS